MNQKVPFALAIVKTLADSFQQDEEIDRAALTSLANTIKNEPQIYPEEEEEAIKTGKVRLDKEQTTVYYCSTTTNNLRLFSRRFTQCTTIARSTRKPKWMTRKLI